MSPENRLKSIQFPSGGGAASTYTYDATGLYQQVKSTIENNSLLWDMQNVLMFQGTTTFQYYTQSPGNWGGLVSQRDNTPTSAFYVFDMSGNTRVLVAADGNTVLDTLNYDAFGIRESGSGTTVTPFQFGGQYGYYLDNEELSLNYVRARWLLNYHGAWTNKDPLTTPAGLGDNPYPYVNNRPVNAVDPMGLWILMIRGGQGNGTPNPDFQHFFDFYQEYFGEFTFRPNWGTHIWAYPPGDAETALFLDTFKDELRSAIDNAIPTSDPDYIWTYGHSYGGTIAARIQSSVDLEVRLKVRDIELNYCVYFNRFVTATAYVQNNPDLFWAVDMNLYTLVGAMHGKMMYNRWPPYDWDECKSWWIIHGCLWWFDPMHYFVGYNGSSDFTWYFGNARNTLVEQARDWPLRGGALSRQSHSTNDSLTLALTPIKALAKSPLVNGACFGLLRIGFF